MTTRLPHHAALVELLTALRGLDYRFVTPTPLTHQRWLANHASQRAGSLREVFGWNLPFDPATLPPEVRAPLQAGALVHPLDQPQQHRGLARAALRVSSLGPDLYVHSPFPTDQADAVFFGPDTYRFARFLDHQLAAAPPAPESRLLDVGCGSGVGGMVAAHHVPRPAVVMNDINPVALGHALVNAEAAGLAVKPALGDAVSACDGDFDLIVCNPPYMADEAARAYRDGGAGLGRALAQRIALQSLERLRPGGRLLLYTGVAILDGYDPFIDELRPPLDAGGFAWAYEELDPDVFGEELERPAYAGVDRIAAVGLSVTRPRA